MLAADDGPVRLEIKVAEAEGASSIGLVILLLTLVPFGVIIFLDLAKLTNAGQQGKKSRLPRLRRRITTQL